MWKDISICRKRTRHIQSDPDSRNRKAGIFPYGITGSSCPPGTSHRLSGAANPRSLYKLKGKDAIEGTTEEMLSCTHYKSLEEIIDAADCGLCVFDSDGESWAITEDGSQMYWKIVKLEETIGYMLITVNEPDADIDEKFYDTREDAVNGMTKEMLSCTGYRTPEDITDAADDDLCHYNPGGKSWAVAKDGYAVYWKITDLSNN